MLGFFYFKRVAISKRNIIYVVFLKINDNTSKKID